MMTPWSGAAQSGSQLTFDFDALVADCLTIAREEHGGVIRSKWAMGARILKELNLIDEEGERKRSVYGAQAVQKIADAMMEEFGDSHGYGPRELYYCIQFAERISENELCDIVAQFKTWRSIEHDFLPDRLGVHFSSETPEWLTPADIVERAVAVLGGIDLDPCSDNHGSPNVAAAHHYTQDDDGLSQRWFGRVYMNPPYGHVIGGWVEKLIHDYEKGDIEQAIALVPARTDTSWFRAFRDYPICFVAGRLRFSEATAGAPFPSAVRYLGPNINAFCDQFAAIGDIYVRIDVSAD